MGETAGRRRLCRIPVQDLARSGRSEPEGGANCNIGSDRVAVSREPKPGMDYAVVMLTKLNMEFMMFAACVERQ